MSNHSLFTAVHRPFAAIYADATARLAATGFPRGLGGAIIAFTSDDLYKEVLQLSDGTRWILTDDSPVTWTQSTGTGSVGVDNSTIEISGGNLRAKDDGITNSKLANMAQATIKGRASGAGTGDPTDLTGTQATAILDNFVGDSGAGGTKGLVPAPGAGDAAAGKFLKADGTFAVPSGTGAETGSNSDITSMDGVTGAIQYPTRIDFTEGAAPSTPAANKVSLYAKDDGLLYSKDDAGTETLVSGGSGGGSIGGSTGSTDNAILRADGTGGTTVQSSAVTIADTTGKITLPSGAGDKIVLGSTNFGIGTESAENSVTVWAQDSFRARYGGTTVGGGTEILRVTGGTTSPASITDGTLSVNISAAKLFKSSSSTGDKMLWQNGSTAYGTGIEADNCVTQWSQDRHRWRIGGSSATSGTETMVLTGSTLAFTNGTALAFTPRTPGQITADQNNYNPGGQSKIQRWSTDASRNVTGLTFSTTQVDGEEHVLVNIGSNDIVLKHQDASSTAANRFLNSTGADITLSANQAADIIYDATTGRWRVFKRN